MARQRFVKSTECDEAPATVSKLDSFIVLHIKRGIHSCVYDSSYLILCSFIFPVKCEHFSNSQHRSVVGLRLWSHNSGITSSETRLFFSLSLHLRLVLINCPEFAPCWYNSSIMCGAAAPVHRQPPHGRFNESIMCVWFFLFFFPLLFSFHTSELSAYRHRLKIAAI